jgi:hypothetical protein
MFRSVIRPTNNSDMGHHHPRLGSPPIAQAFLLERPRHHTVTPTPSEADMPHTTISGHHVAHPNGRRLMKTIKQLLNMEIYQNVIQQK